MDDHEHKAASDVLQGVVDGHNSDYISLRDIKMALHERGFGVLMIIFSLPMCVPAVPPGMTLIPAIPLLFFSIQMAMDEIPLGFQSGLVSVKLSVRHWRGS